MWYDQPDCGACMTVKEYNEAKYGEPDHELKAEDDENQRAHEENPVYHAQHSPATEPGSTTDDGTSSSSSDTTSSSSDDNLVIPDNNDGRSLQATRLLGLAMAFNFINASPSSQKKQIEMRNKQEEKRKKTASTSTAPSEGKENIGMVCLFVFLIVRYEVHVMI